MSFRQRMCTILATAGERSRRIRVRRRGGASGALIAVTLAMNLACQPMASTKTPAEPDRTTLSGTLGGPCYGNRTCNPGLACDIASRQCTPGNTGLRGGACFHDGTCTGTLVCNQGICAEAPAQNCRKDQHCLDGQVCVDNFCKPGPAPDAQE